MSADSNGGGNVSVPLRILLNSIQCVRDRVRDGESNESDGAFNLSNFWDTLNQAVKAVSQEATKLSLAFSKPPLPSQQRVSRLHPEECPDSVHGVLLATEERLRYHSPPTGPRRHVEVLEGVAQLVEVILSSPLQSLTQEQLTSTGGVWSACDQFAQLPQDNKAAVLVVLSDQIGVVKDAIEEIEQALSNAHDPFSDVLDDDQDGEEPRENQDTYWSEKDRSVIAPCQGLMKASAACIRKLSAAVKANGNFSTPENVAQLDDLADISKEISPGVDDLALCLYPPMDYSGVQNNVNGHQSTTLGLATTSALHHVGTCQEVTGDLSGHQSKYE
ncbi:Cyclin-D1-binding protein 1-like protein Zebrafish-like protein of Maid [Larimichthys crocea]|uniref:Cyclin-D1-binding protein 1-like protein Zebrafish-like protein of Maid n=1 Tax=Larimichthys crocea TaxID=215358 RepID=A0A6G0J5T0_LARCR|nr:Cyclin-D1-binding protein 1-like protein Zebrafish-like protein of Maid [Larimichthys crocea]